MASLYGMFGSCIGCIRQRISFVLHRLGRARSAAPAVFAQLLAELLPIWMADLTASLNRAALEGLAVTLMANGRANAGQAAEDDPAIGVLLEELRRDPDLMSQVTALDVITGGTTLLRIATTSRGSTGEMAADVGGAGRSDEAATEHGG